MTGLNAFQVKVTNILSAIDAAEYLIAHNASHVVKQVGDNRIIRFQACRQGDFVFQNKNSPKCFDVCCVQETKGYMQSLVGYFRQYTQWVENSVSVTCPSHFYSLYCFFFLR